jgi:hypothetical protein
MEQNPSWETNRFSASQELPRIFWSPKVHYRIHKCPQPVPVLSQLNPIHAPHLTFWLSILILSFHLRLVLPNGLFPSDFPTKTPYTPLPFPYTCYTPLQSHSSRLNHPNNIGWGVQIIEILIMYFPPLSCYPSVLGPNVLLINYPSFTSIWALLSAV